MSAVDTVLFIAVLAIWLILIVNLISPLQVTAFI